MQKPSPAILSWLGMITAHSALPSTAGKARQPLMRLGIEKAGMDLACYCSSIPDIAIVISGVNHQVSVADDRLVLGWIAEEPAVVVGSSWKCGCGGVLLSHTLSGAVPSPCQVLASGFGMGPGVSPGL